MIMTVLVIVIAVMVMTVLLLMFVVVVVVVDMLLVAGMLMRTPLFLLLQVVRIRRCLRYFDDSLLVLCVLT